CRNSFSGCPPRSTSTKWPERPPAATCRLPRNSPPVTDPIQSLSSSGNSAITLPVRRGPSEEPAVSEPTEGKHRLLGVTSPCEIDLTERTVRLHSGGRDRPRPMG